MTPACFVLFCSLLFGADDPKSAALIQTLPADGAWVTFEVNIKANGTDVSPTWVVRSVGKSECDGKPCRMIELEQKCQTPPFGNVTWKLLVPESEFGEGKHPFGNALRIWIQREAEAPQVVESIAKEDPIFGTLIVGPTSDVMVLKEQEKVGWQRGNLDCAVVTGTRESDFFGAKMKMSHRVLRHKEVPFGLAGMKQELNFGVGGANQEVKITMTLQDHGLDAKAKLPDLKP